MNGNPSQLIAAAIGVGLVPVYVFWDSARQPRFFDATAQELAADRTCISAEN